MAVKYDVYKTPVPDSEEKRYSLHARVVSIDTVTTDDLARKIEYGSTLTDSDIIAVLRALSYHVTDQLAQGKRVHLDGLGYFYLTASSPSVQKASEIRGDMVHFKSVKFRAEKNMKNKLQKVKFERTDETRHSLPHTVRKIEELLAIHFRDQDLITRKQFQLLCGFTKSMALKWMKNLVEEGILIKNGSPQAPVYQWSNRTNE